MSQSITLGYWGIRGRGQVLRLLLAYTGAEWTQKKYFNPDDWKGIGKDQTSLGLPFPNLPYLVHDDFKLTQSRAIMNYIINISDKKQLLGKDIKDEATVASLVSVFLEILTKIIELVFDHENFDSKRSDVQRLVQSKLQNFQQHFDSKDFVLGYLTLADFVIAETSHYVQNVFPELYQKYRSISLIRKSFENIKEIQSYYQQQNSVKGPFLPPIGKIKF